MASSYQYLQGLADASLTAETEEEQKADLYHYAAEAAAAEEDGEAELTSSSSFTSLAGPGVRGYIIGHARNNM